MNNDKYLRFIHELIKSNQIREQTHIQKISNGRVVKDQDTIPKKVQIKKCIVGFELSNRKILLVEEAPFNFFLNYTILIGEDSNLVSFKLNNGDERTYLCEKYLLKIISDKIDKQSVETFLAKNLENISFTSPYIVPRIIDSIRDYVNHSKKLDLNKVHITKSSSIELFLPSVYAHHFKLAQTIEVPLKTLVEDNYIKETNINVYDINHQIDLLKPFHIREERVTWEITKEDHNKIYKDVVVDYILRIDEDYFSRKLDDVPLDSQKRKELEKAISSVRTVQLTTNKGEIPFPIWKSYHKQAFVEIKDTAEFRELTGRPFRLESDFLSNIFILAEQGNDALYKDKYLKKDVQKIIEEGIQEIHIMSYHSSKELVIKLLLQSDIKQIIELKENRENTFKEIESHLEKSISFYISKLVETNYVEDNEEYSLHGEYYVLLTQTILNLLKEYQDKLITFENLQKELLRHVRNSHKFLTITKYDKKDSFVIGQALYSLCSLYSLFNPFYADKKRHFIKDYIKGDKLSIVTPIEFEEDKLLFFEHSIIGSELKRQKEKPLIVIHESFEAKKLPTPLKFLNEGPLKTFRKPRKGALRKQFPYTHEKIYRLLLDNPDLDQVTIDQRTLKIHERFFSKHREYRNHKVVAENNYFSLLLPASNKKTRVKR